VKGRPTTKADVALMLLGIYMIVGPLAASAFFIVGLSWVVVFSRVEGWFFFVIGASFAVTSAFAWRTVVRKNQQRSE